MPSWEHLSSVYQIQKFVSDALLNKLLINIKFKLVDDIECILFYDNGGLLKFFKNHMSSKGSWIFDCLRVAKI